MKPTKKQAHNFVQKILEDKKAIAKCVRNGGNIQIAAKERGIKLATPV